MPLRLLEDRGLRRSLATLWIVFVGYALLRILTAPEAFSIGDFRFAISHEHLAAAGGSRWQHHPAPHGFGTDPRRARIFVSIASFRDEQCGHTLVELFRRAKHPHRVFVGVVEQHLSGQDPSCAPRHATTCAPGREEDCVLSHHVRVVHVPPHRAKGPTFGRYMAMKLYRGEEYYMMIDSHNRFVTGWDRIAIGMHRSLVQRQGHPRVVLSHYPQGYTTEWSQMKMDNDRATTFLCQANFIDVGYPRFHGFVVGGGVMRQQPFAAAGFLFANASMVQEVPFDPHLDYIFDGEEILYSVRMWTHGYDIFSPMRNVLFHFYGRAEAKRIWSEPGVGDWYRRQQQSIQRVQLLLQVVRKGTNDRIVPDNETNANVTMELDRYGLGTRRSLADYWAEAGLDIVNHNATRSLCPT